MKVIMIRDEEAKALVDKLELIKLRAKEMGDDKRMSIDEMHRAFHYEVVCWLQEAGAKIP